MVEKTFAIIKPHAVAAKHMGEILSMIEKNGFEIIGMEKTQLSKEQAEHFYAIHNKKPFFGGLVGNIISGPVIVMVLQKDNAIKAWRDFMGATDPMQAAPGSLRKLFGTSIDFNATHGSDSPENATLEIRQFFPNLA